MTKINLEDFDFLEPCVGYDDNGYGQYCPSEVEDLTEDFIKSIMGSVNARLKNRLKNIIDENTSLKSQNENLRKEHSKMKSSSESIIREYENKLSNIELEWQTGKRKGVFNVMNEAKVVYGVGRRMEFEPKCEKCNDKYEREIEVDGINVKFKCQCHKSYYVYGVSEMLVIPKKIEEHLSSYKSDRKTIVYYSIVEKYKEPSRWDNNRYYECELKQQDVLNNIEEYRKRTFYDGQGFAFLNLQDAKVICEELNSKQRR